MNGREDRRGRRSSRGAGSRRGPRGRRPEHDASRRPPARRGAPGSPDTRDNVSTGPPPRRRRRSERGLRSSSDSARSPSPLDSAQKWNPLSQEELRRHYTDQLDRLGRRLEAGGLELTPRRRERLIDYSLLVAERAQAFNLVSRRDLPSLVEKHIGASLGPLLYLQDYEWRLWADIGTGAGLPGLVLNIWNEDQPVVLIESSGKRCLFLEEARRRLGLSFRILQQRGQELDRADLGGHEGASPGEETGASAMTAGGSGPVAWLMRAVTPLAKALDWVPGLLGRSDVWLFYAGPGWGAWVASHEGELADTGVELQSCLEIPWAPGRLLVWQRS
ncbi:MAG: hypothetical protein GF355_06410 [Candidatus Eisenbacteria bacterium]|nr:hypothetical protein [Candidatus Eisenbacteria bacterium]